MSDQAPAITPADILTVQGQEVTVTLSDGKQVRALVTNSGVHFDRIDVTTEKKWLETQEREYIDGPKVATLTLQVLL
jgi:hypothetical protein